jgi:hypothetical protein
MPYEGYGIRFRVADGVLTVLEVKREKGEKKKK